MKAIASKPPGLALVPLKCYSRNLQFPHRVPIYQRMPWCPCSFKTQHTDLHAMFDLNLWRSDTAVLIVTMLSFNEKGCGGTVMRRYFGGLRFELWNVMVLNITSSNQEK